MTKKEWRDRGGRTAKDIERSLPLDLGHVPVPDAKLRKVFKTRSSAVQAEVYISAVRGRREFRAALAEERKVSEALRDKRHSLCVALMAAEATLTMLAGATKGCPYRETRRAETVKIVRSALAESGYSNE